MFETSCVLSATPSFSPATVRIATRFTKSQTETVTSMAQLGSDHSEEREGGKVFRTCSERKVTTLHLHPKCKENDKKEH